MEYSIGEAAKMTGLTAHTIRFYDKEGLLPFIERDQSGNRIFSDVDFRWLSLINCFKKSGMPIKQIKQYLEWSAEGDATLEQRLEAMKSHRKVIEEKMAELQEYLDTIDHKIDYYNVALEAGTEAIHHEQKSKPDKSKKAEKVMQKTAV